MAAIEAQVDWLSKQLNKLLGAKSIWKLEAGGVPSTKLMSKLQTIYEQSAAKFKLTGASYPFSEMITDMEKAAPNTIAKVQADVLRRAGAVAGDMGGSRPTATRIKRGISKLKGYYEQSKTHAIKEVQENVQRSTAASASEAASYKAAAGYKGATGVTNVKAIRAPYPAAGANVAGPVASGKALVKVDPERLARVGKAMRTKSMATKALSTAGLGLIALDFVGRGIETQNQMKDMEMEGQQIEAMAAAQSPESMYYEAMLPQMQQQTQMGHQAIMQRLMGGGGGTQLAEGEMQI